MNLNNLSLPHPVLGLGDDMQGEYSVECNKEIFIDRIILKITHALKHDTIAEMINTGNATYGVEINCPQTVFRQMYVSEKNQHEIVINADDLRGKVIINFFIVSAVETSKYNPAAINKDYGNATFSIGEGDVLGYGGSTYFYADKRWKESESISSFMCIIKSDKKDGPMTYDLMSDRINICLPEHDYDNYKQAGGDFKKIFNIYHGALVYPALLYALVKLFIESEDDELLKSYDWYTQLSDRLDYDSRFKDIPRVIENAPLIAQMLLSSKEDGMPIARTLSCVKDIVDETYKIEE